MSPTSRPADPAPPRRLHAEDTVHAVNAPFGTPPSPRARAPASP